MKLTVMDRVSLKPLDIATLKTGQLVYVEQETGTYYGALRATITRVWTDDNGSPCIEWAYENGRGYGTNAE